jgi:putative spermidine/putrescine transport system substrate-binding protein
MRRTIVVAASGLAPLALVLAACSGNGPAATGSASGGGTADSGGSGGGNTITVAASDDTNIQELFQQTLIPDFQAANPGTTVKLTYDLHGTNDQANFAKLAAASQQGRDPAMDVTASFVQKAAKAGLLVTDVSKVTNLNGVDSKIIAAGGPGAVPYRASSVLLAYNPEKVSNPPKTLDELLAWIKANPGRFTYNSPKSGGSGGAFVTTVLDSKVPQADRDQMTTAYKKELEKDWDPGWQILASLNPYVFQKGVYPNGNNQTLQLLSSGQIDMAPVWSDQFISGQASGSIPKTMKVQQISNPSFTGGASYLGVVKGSKNQDLAFKFVNFILQPDEQAKIAEKIAGYPAIPLSKLAPDVQAKFKDADTQNLRPGYYADHATDINNLWDQNVPGK